MHKISQSIIVTLLIVLSGCASEPKRPGIPDWDYERDEVRGVLGGAASGALLGAVLGALIDGEKSAAIGAGAGALLGGLVKDEIELTPSELRYIIYVALVDYTRNEELLLTTISGDDLITTYWNISEPNEGQFVTDWKPIPGMKKGLLWWEKIYKTEVRHIITIKRSYRSPCNTNFAIHTKVRERPNSKYKWFQGDPELGRTSFEDIKNTLLARIRIYLKNRKVKVIKIQEDRANED